MKHLHPPTESKPPSPAKVKTPWERFKSFSRTASKSMFLSSMFVLGTGAGERGCRNYQDLHQVAYEARQLQETCDGIRTSGVIQRELASYPPELAEGITEVRIIPRSFPINLLHILNINDEEKEGILDNRDLGGSLIPNQDGRSRMLLYYDMPGKLINDSTIHHEFAHHVWKSLDESQKDKLSQLLESELSISDERKFVMDAYMKDKFYDFSSKSLRLHSVLIKREIAISKKISSSMQEVRELKDDAISKIKAEMANNPKSALMRSYLLTYLALDARDKMLLQARPELDKLDSLLDDFPTDEEWDAARKGKDITAHLAFYEKMALKFDDMISAFRRVESQFPESNEEKINAPDFGQVARNIRNFYYSELFARAVGAAKDGKTLSCELSDSILGIEIDGRKAYNRLPPAPPTSAIGAPAPSSGTTIVCPFDEKDVILL